MQLMQSATLRRFGRTPVDRRVRRLLWFALRLWTAAIALSPIYLTSSGSVQVADYVFLGVVALVVLAGLALSGRAQAGAIALWVFVTYVAIVNSSWSLQLAAQFPFAGLPFGTTAFYVFNALLVTAGLSLASRDADRFIDATRSGIQVAVSLNVIGLVAAGLSGGRETVFFNNPNQLGYFAVLAGAITVVVSNRKRAISDALVLSACAVLAAASLSKAAMVAMLFSVAVLLLRGRIVLTLFVLLASASLVVTPFGDQLVSGARDRLGSIGEDADDSLVGRGYDRLISSPHLAVLGAGEGAHSRFGSGSEFHSSPGTLLFAYGVFGTALFVTFLAAVWSFRSAWVWLAASPILVYGLTHQGLRARLLWVFIAVGYALVQRRRATVWPEDSSAA